MKRIFLLVLAALLVCACCACDGAGGKEEPPESVKTDPVEIGEISYFYFTESNGSDPDMRVFYRLEYADGAYTATLKPEGVKDEDKLVVNVDRDFVDRLETVLKEHDVGSWNGYDEADTDIMDGIGFCLHADMTDGTEIDATGYMEWPPGYGVTASDIHGLFMDLYEQNT